MQNSFQIQKPNEIQLNIFSLNIWQLPLQIAHESRRRFNILKQYL